MAIRNIERKWIDEFIEISRRVPKRGLTTGGGGGISMRVPGSEKILIKGWEVPSEDLREEDICVVDIEGSPLNDVRICLEGPLHLEVLKTRKEIGSVIHAHPPYSTAFGNILPQLSESDLANYSFLRQGVFTPFAEPGSVDLARYVSEPFRDPGVTFVFMQDHGVAVVGADIRSAYHRLDFLEGAAKAFVLTALLKKAFQP
ncbi:MAG TPA: class II aldolase/adducin family protein [Thermodesulfobacteriota bacterium]|nr:class II aldolase/adducin family protein [Thermodesulfobacteriota bacterium]